MLNYECKVETKSPIRRELTISVKPESIQTMMDQQFASLQKKAKIKGFREGKVPLNILKQYYMQDVKSDVFSRAIRDSYIQALEENKIVAVGTPEIETKSGAELNGGEPLTFTAKIEIFPEIKIGDLSKIKVARVSDEVTDEDAEKAMQNLRESHAEIVPHEEYAGPAKEGDYLELTFKGTVGGEALPSLQGENRLVQIGAKQYMEEFENALVGLKKGESKEFPVAFPETFSEEKLAGKTAQFHVTVHEFKRKQLPELDDEFAKRFKLETALELRKKMLESMKEDKAKEAKDKLRQTVLETLVKEHSFEVPQGLINSQVEYLVRENVEYLKRHGFTEKMIRDYLEKNREDLAKRAEEQVRASLILDRISQDEGIKAEAADLEREYATMAERVGLQAAQVREFYENDDNALRQLRFRIKEDRAFDFILSKIKITS